MAWNPLQGLWPVLRGRTTHVADWLRGGTGGGSADGDSPGAMPRPLLLFLVLFMVGMALISLVGDHGWLAYHTMSMEHRALEQEVVRLRARHTQLIQEIEALRDDPAYQEHMARKRLGLVKPGEVVLQYPTGAAHSLD